MVVRYRGSIVTAEKNHPPPTEVLTPALWLRAKRQNAPDSTYMIPDSWYNTGRARQQETPTLSNPEILIVTPSVNNLEHRLLYRI